MTKKSSLERYFNVINKIPPKFRELAYSLDTNSSKDLKIYRNIIANPSLSEISTKAQLRIVKQFYNTVIKEPNKTVIRFAKSKGLTLKETNTDPNLILENKEKVKSYSKTIQRKKQKIIAGTTPKVIKRHYSVNSFKDVETSARMGVNLGSIYKKTQIRLILKVLLDNGQETYISTSNYNFNNLEECLNSLQNWIIVISGNDEFYYGQLIDSYEKLLIELR